MLEALSSYFIKSENNLINNNILDICSQLNEIGYENELKIPQIVAVGTQSSGKSLTLNNIINYPILPVGSVMTTKTPIRIELRNNNIENIQIGYINNNELDFNEKYKCGTTNIEYETITEYINELTNIFIGKNKESISNKEIIIKINSIKVPNLNLIDLPGLIAINKTEDDTKTAIRNLAKKYIEKKNIIILGIFPARLDLETDFALELIKEYDTNFERTIGCLTKIDLLSNGDISNYITNNITDNLKLKYGYYAIKNVGDESTYFNTHNIYSKLENKDNLGISNLTIKLNKILIEEISSILPNIIDKIEHKLSTINNELLKLGEEFISENKEYAYNVIINNFNQCFVNALENNVININYGKKIKEIFVQYRTELNNLEPFQNLDEDDIKLLIINNEKNQMFIEINYIEILEQIFKNKNRPINILESISYDCANKIYNTLFNLIDEIIEYNNLHKYTNLIIHIKKVIKKELDIHMKQIKNQINNIILYEESYLWTENPAFINKYKELKNTEKNDTNLIKQLCITYFNTIKDNFENIIPKIIMYSLIKTLEIKMSILLVSNNKTKLLEENSDIAKKRHLLKIERTKLEHITQIINELL